MVNQLMGQYKKYMGLHIATVGVAMAAAWISAFCEDKKRREALLLRPPLNPNL